MHDAEASLVAPPAPGAGACPRQAPFATAWALSDGKAGDELQCVAVIEALGLVADVRRVAPRPPWSWLMPWGPVDPAETPGRDDGPLAGPLPDLLVASGRRAVAYARHIRRISRGRTFTVFLKDPRTHKGVADLIWAPDHDHLSGPNIISTLTSPHRLSPARLAAARAAPLPALAALPQPRVAVLVGGDSRRHRFTPGDISAFRTRLAQLCASGAGLMMTTSRRTPPALAEAVAALARRHGCYLWDGADPNPYIDIMALAEAVVVSADSTNMIGEAAATGRPVLVFAPHGDDRKTSALIHGLEAAGIVHDFTGRLAGSAYPPLNSTPIIAEEILRAYARKLASSASHASSAC